jgi:DNA-binding transcriptional LysR family regulator
MPLLPVRVEQEQVLPEKAARNASISSRSPCTTSTPSGNLVSRDIVGGRLARWGDVVGSDIALWALYPTRRLLSARVSALLDLLRKSFPQAAPEELAAYLDG